MTWGNVLPAPGRLAQWESASFTPKRSLVRTQYRPPGPSARLLFSRRADGVSPRSSGVGARVRRRRRRRRRRLGRTPENPLDPRPPEPPSIAGCGRREGGRGPHGRPTARNAMRRCFRPAAHPSSPGQGPPRPARVRVETPASCLAHNGRSPGSSAVHFRPRGPPPGPPGDLLPAPPGTSSRPPRGPHRRPEPSRCPAPPPRPRFSAGASTRRARSVLRPRIAHLHVLRPGRPAPPPRRSPLAARAREKFLSESLTLSPPLRTLCQQALS